MRRWRNPPRPLPLPDALLLDFRETWAQYIIDRGFQWTPTVYSMAIERVEDRDGERVLSFTSTNVSSEGTIMLDRGGNMARNFARDLQVDRIEFVKGELNGTGH